MQNKTMLVLCYLRCLLWKSLLPSRIYQGTGPVSQNPPKIFCVFGPQFRIGNGASQMAIGLNTPWIVHRGELSLSRENKLQSYSEPSLMNKNPLNKGMIQQNSAGIGEISEAMVAERAKELALIAGHSVNKVDHRNALRELSGGPEMDSEQGMLESLSEEERWDPVPSSNGHQAEEAASEEENEDGRGEDAQLVEEGVSEAAHDQMLQAAKAARLQDKPGRDDPPPRSVVS